MLYLYQDSIILELRKCANKDTNVQTIIIYGSYARKEHQPDSDLDILIVTSNITKSKQIFTKIREKIYLETSVPLSFSYTSPNEYYNSKDPFINMIKKEGEIIWSANKTT
jgi:predicted nucleotidyltransferase